MLHCKTEVIIMSGAEAVFTQALGLASPWEVERVEFRPEQSRIDMFIVYGSNVGQCPACGAQDKPVHDRRSRVWQHLNFFQFEALALTAAADDLKAHGGDPDAMELICMDMPGGFKKGAAQYLPNAAIAFDRFHIIQLANKAVDEVRRDEASYEYNLKRTRWIWLKDSDQLYT